MVQRPLRHAEVTAWYNDQPHETGSNGVVQRPPIPIKAGSNSVVQRPPEQKTLSQTAWCNDQPNKTARNGVVQRPPKQGRANGVVQRLPDQDGDENNAVTRTSKNQKDESMLTCSQHATTHVAISTLKMQVSLTMNQRISSSNSTED